MSGEDCVLPAAKVVGEWGAQSPCVPHAESKALVNSLNNHTGV